LVDVPIFRRSSPTVRENSAVAASYSDANRIFSSHPILPRETSICPLVG
jgi:hypothetical protein